MRAAIDKIGNWLPQGYGDAARQLSLFVVAELCYEAVRGVADGQRMTAIANGQHVISFEKSIHTFFEPDLQKVFIDHRWIIDFANFMYMNSHFVVTTGVPGLALHLPEPELLLRAQHVHGRDGAGAGRLRADAHGASPDVPGRRIHRHDHRPTPRSTTTRAWSSSSSTPTPQSLACTAPSPHGRRNRGVDLASQDHQGSGASIPLSSSGSSWSPRTTSGSTVPRARSSQRCRRWSPPAVLARGRPGVWSWRPATA